MIERSSSPRDRALIAVLYESGFRIGEALNMRISDVAPDLQGARVRVSGKTGPRTVRLITSVPQLTAWLENHPLKRESQSWIWASLAHSCIGSQLEYHSVSAILKNAAKRAEVQKRVYPHLFRHSAATRDAHFLNEAELRIKYGWERNSTSPSIYVHLAAADVEQKLIAIYAGKAAEQQAPDYVPIMCSRCGERCGPGMVFCPRCGTPLSQEELAKAGIDGTIMVDRLLNLEEKLARILSENSQKKGDSS